ncbi:Exonuclease 1 [Paramuricea clavata]|uniref:Exonuclease 1 n=1 Tax=Paramuricea clavata TaxID=317549 RepID=A0A7D9J3Z3_PARCT|nr:Exonuclease 1 [Paramuricea clavata]
MGEAWFSWMVPSFPVLSISLRKIKFRCNGEDYNGVVSKDANVKPGQYTCTSHCKINIDSEEYTVLWVVLPLVCCSLEQDADHSQEETDTDFEGPHTLPFKVMGTCYCSSRQDILEKGYLNLNDYNWHVYAKLEDEPENITDNEAIAVYISVDYCGDEFQKVGYIAKELTQYLKPILKKLDVSVCNICFCTTYYRMGYYLTLEITKDGMWHKNVVEASKNVR